MLWTFPVKVKTSHSAVSEDGAWVALVTGADLNGGNQSGEEQLFLRRTDGSETRQLTATTPGDEGAISGNGTLTRSLGRGIALSSPPIGIRSGRTHRTTTNSSSWTPMGRT